MAAVTLFEEFARDIGQGDHSLSNLSNIRMALYTATAAWAANATNPAYTATNECSGTGYTAKGPVITGIDYTELNGTATLSATSAAWTSLTLGTAARYGLIYNDDATGDEAIGFVDFGSGYGTGGGDLTVTFTNSKIFDLS